jgi:hypothetical protein
MTSEDVIFLVSSSGQLSELAVTGYETEAMLQELSARHPGLLVGGQITPGNPRRWLLVSRAGNAVRSDEADGGAAPALSATKIQ